MNALDTEIFGQIASIIQNALGMDVEPENISELGGGTFNQVYLVEPPNDEKLVVRIAPVEDENTHWDDSRLMRREYAIQPYFSAVSSLMPTIVTVDFTQRLLGRDFMIQSYVEGERWEDLEDELEEDNMLILWEQFGNLNRKIHDTVGVQFGWPHPGKSYAHWHAPIVDRFEKTIADLSAHGLDIFPMSNVLAFLHSESEILNGVTQPHLLHGDLWLFNLLVNRKIPEIVGVLDADRAWWGDPLADWAIFALAIRDGEGLWNGPRAAFERGYGPIVTNRQDAQRLEIYKIMHLGTIADWAARNGYLDDVKRACQKQAELAERFLR